MSTRRRGGRSASTLDITSLPPIETIDPDKAKDFEKDQIKTYLEFYEVEPATTKPDMKKQLKMLINAIRRGEVPRKPLNGPAPEAPSAAISMPIIVERAPPTTTATPAPVPVTLSTLPDVAVDLYLPAILPTGPMAPAPVSFVDSLYPGLPGLMGLGNKLTLPALEELGDDLLPRLEKETIEAVCVQCGKRANRDCRFDRCKNCCVTGNYACKEHARYMPGQQMGTVEISPEMEKKMREEEAAAKATAAGLDPTKAVEILQQEEAAKAALAAASAAPASGDAVEVKLENGVAAPAASADVGDGKPPVFAALPDETTFQHMLMNHVMSHHAIPVGIDLAAEPGFEGPEFDPPMVRASKEARKRMIANLEAMMEIFGNDGRSKSLKAVLDELRQTDPSETQLLEDMRRKLRKLDTEAEEELNKYKKLHTDTAERSDKFDGTLKSIHKASTSAELRKLKQEIQQTYKLDKSELDDNNVTGFARPELKRIQRPKDGRLTVAAKSFITIQ